MHKILWIFQKCFTFNIFLHAKATFFGLLKKRKFCDKKKEDYFAEKTLFGFLKQREFLSQKKEDSNKQDSHVSTACTVCSAGSPR